MKTATTWRVNIVNGRAIQQQQFVLSARVDILRRKMGREWLSREREMLCIEWLLDISTLDYGLDIVSVNNSCIQI
jgi:hypothetical protein